MKKLTRNLVLWFLIVLARARLRRLRLFVIGVTGSIGKTSTKDAIFSILKTRYNVYRSEKSLNSEFGLPLAILQQPSGFSSPSKWLKIMLGALWSAFFNRKNLQMLVVEMGVDKPGDMDNLLRLIKPNVGVITNINPVHMAPGQFKNLEEIFKEKKKLVESLPEKGISIVNADDPYLMTLKDSLKCKKIFYGFSEYANLRVIEVKSTAQGLKFILKYNDEIAEGVMPLLGGFQIYVVLPAIALAISQGFSLQEAISALKNYKLPQGRMNPIEGINGSLIIDSTYNASPTAVKEALDVLKTGEGRKIAVLGNMNELGDNTEEKHREVGAYAVGRTDILITVGNSAKLIAEEALANGMRGGNIYQFDTAREAGEFLQKNIRAGDTILMKGSQNQVRLERAVKMIMKNPELASQLLVRQGTEWDNIE